MLTLLRRFAADDAGATAIEYGLIAGLIAIAIIASARTLGTNLGRRFTVVASNLT